MELRMDGVPSDKNAEYRDGLEEFFRSRGSFAVMGVDDANEVMNRVYSSSAPGSDMRAQEIAEQLTNGANLLVTDVKGGIEVLEDACSQVEAFRSKTRESPEMREQHLLGEMLLVRSLLEADREEDAHNRLRNIIIEYGEDLEVTRSRFHPRVVTAYQVVWDGMDGAARGSLRVPSESGSTKVSLNGRVVEAGPEGNISGLLTGKYRVQLIKDGRFGRIHFVEVASGSTVDLSPQWFEEINLFSAKGILGISVPPAIAPAKTVVALASRVGVDLQADYVTMIGVLPWKEGYRMFAVLVDVTNKTRLWAKSWDVAPAAYASDRLVQIGQKIASDWGVAHAGGFTGTPRWYKSIAGWSLVALGIGGVVTSTVYGVRYSDKTDELNESAKNPSFGIKQAKILQEDAESMGTVSVIAGVAGGVAIATGIALFLIEEWGNEPSTSMARKPMMWGGVMPSADGSAGFGMSFQMSF